MPRFEGRFVVVGMARGIENSPCCRGMRQGLREESRPIGEDSDVGDAVVRVVSQALCMARDNFAGVRREFGNDLDVAFANVFVGARVVGADGRLPEGTVGEDAFKVVASENAVVFSGGPKDFVYLFHVVLASLAVVWAFPY